MTNNPKENERSDSMLQDGDGVLIPSAVIVKGGGLSEISNVADVFKAVRESAATGSGPQQ